MAGAQHLCAVRGQLLIELCGAGRVAGRPGPVCGAVTGGEGELVGASAQLLAVGGQDGVQVPSLLGPAVASRGIGRTLLGSEGQFVAVAEDTAAVLRERLEQTDRLVRPGGVRPVRLCQ
ncbi:hypothetical protein ABZZ74_37810 [Streptomyces sp. NPDC006476]|uniref:hypothetical protein n=1 Tax=Streptomyces sp. NPDC006476 TaxID=3157175 RepID=UPI0033A96DA3